MPPVESWRDLRVSRIAGHPKPSATGFATGLHAKMRRRLGACVVFVQQRVVGADEFAVLVGASTFGPVPNPAQEEIALRLAHAPALRAEPRAQCRGIPETFRLTVFCPRGVNCLDHSRFLAIDSCASLSLENRVSPLVEERHTATRPEGGCGPPLGLRPAENLFAPATAARAVGVPDQLDTLPRLRVPRAVGARRFRAAESRPHARLSARPER